jgi:hypothetical protein
VNPLLFLHQKKLRKAKAYYEKSGYKVEEIPNNTVWDLFCVSGSGDCYVQIFTTVERMKLIDRHLKMLPHRSHVEVVRYTNVFFPDNTPSNRVVYPSG